MSEAQIPVTEESCGETHPLIDNGSPCIKFQGHEEYKGLRHHLTANGFWWV